MHKLNSIDEYKIMRKKVRENSQNIFSNIFFFPADLEPYIKTERALCEEVEKGFILFLEEDKYYKVYVYADTNQEIIIAPLEKKIVFRHTYRQGKGEECPKEIENCLIANNFTKDGTLVYIHANVDDLYNRCLKIEPYVKKMEKQGYCFRELDETYYGEVEKLLLSTGMTRDYHLECNGESDLKTCHAIVNNDGELCAVCMGFIEGKNVTGALMVREEYKMNGLAPMLSFYRYKWMKDINMKQNIGWIYVDNQASLHYFRGLGFELENKYIDEWILIRK